ncbi:MAG: hypothetical protein JNK82_26315, partial [Myxococcaceae bacterium]|nr:hypothetical protein [Myxococcaceae bacterium]
MPFVLLLSLLAARDARLAAAIDRYETAKFTAARDALIELVDRPELEETERIDARTYLAACYLELRDRGSAKLQLRELARRFPGARPSPATFAPELISLANEVWAELEKWRPAEPAPAAARPLVVEAVAPAPPVAPREKAAPSRALAFVPFGIGHFARGDSAQGAVWLLAQVALFGIAAGALAGLDALIVDGGAFKGGTVYRDQLGTAEALKFTYPVAFWAG